MSVLNTRRALRWVGVLMILSLLLSACAAPAAAPSAPAAGGEEAAAAPSDELTRENTLVFAADLTDLITLDPAVAYEFGGILPVGNIYETLVSFNPGDPELVPLLAESWDIADNGDMWKLTFKLNPAAKFASGNPVTADDVAFSLGRAIDINKSPAFLLTDVCQMLKDNVTAVDAGTLEVKIPKTVSPHVCSVGADLHHGCRRGKGRGGAEPGQLTLASPG